MKTSTTEGKHGIQLSSRMQLDDVDFTDDLALLSRTQKQMQEKTNSVAAASAAIGLNIHKGKSKILRYNTACTDPITIDGEDLEDVKSSIIDEHDGSDADVKARICKTRSAYLQLKNIWNSKQLSTNTKIAVHHLKQPSSPFICNNLRGWVAFTGDSKRSRPTDSNAHDHSNQHPAELQIIILFMNELFYN
ncbi:unnamed protein product [Schistosoma margrebowiei]|uniref:Uncharacterized protein n=1 Tax=Schistosoma margrebowiei TaxID=48269 RepID=A0A183MWB5_9TREM|nr:unnamed protein product [Schistosoma margrebowiei]